MSFRRGRVQRFDQPLIERLRAETALVTDQVTAASAEGLLEAGRRARAERLLPKAWFTCGVCQLPLQRLPELVAHVGKRHGDKWPAVRRFA